eukprot:TRINITY_DN621_c0_g1_i1.p1 TRINITY_DN621_c0_g1~~TRINITY_DN621_c0_g1_i1.p1  ORF type:complete len:502 (-),score=68.39 TRINITY_DN621_c0_g1_i1:29-1534(-)
MFRQLLFISFFCLFPICYSSYIAAALEHYPIERPGPTTRLEAQKIMFENLDIYEKYIQIAVQQEAQIIVFPEYGLFGENYFETRDSIYPYLEQIPNPANATEPIIPCQNSTYDEQPVLQRSSCLAKQYDIYIALDLGDLQPCNISSNPNCPEDGRFQFNTQIALSPTGQLLAKYHKIHLFEEPFYNPADPPLPVSFTTDFGVTFGMLICFDMAFQTPSFEYAEQGIKDIVFSTAWVNTPPVQTATQAQQGWSMNYQANFIAANLGDSYHTSGSGIYHNGTVLTSYFNPHKNTSEQLLIATLLSSNENMTRPVPSQNQKNTFTSPSSLSDDFGSLNESKGTVIRTFKALKGSSGSFEVTVNNLTCSVNYTVSDTTPEEDLFAFAAIDVHQIPLIFPSSLEYCGLFRCNGGTDDLCSFYLVRGLESNTNFSSISVWGTFQSDVYGVLPLAASNEGQNLPSELVYYEKSDTWASFSISAVDANINVLDFGIFSATSLDFKSANK